MRIKVGVIFGGVSVEHEISVITAVQAMKAINEEKYEVIPLYIDKERNMYTGKLLMDMDSYKDMDLLKKYATRVVLYTQNGHYYLQKLGLFKKNINEIDIAFPIVHGSGVEDGSLAGYLETIGIPYVGPNVLSAALGQDKVVMKQIFESNNLPVVDYTWFFDYEYLEDKELILEKIKNIGYPVIVKPASLGSSIGITVVHSESEIDEAINEAINYDKKILIEKMVQNLTEVNCSVKGAVSDCSTSAVEEVLSSDEILSFNDKYVNGNKSKGMAASVGRIIPARLSSEALEEIKNLSIKVFRVLNLSGICRIDYLVDKDTNKIYINEPNTIPGSLSFYLWEPVGIKYTDLLDQAITTSIREYKKKQRKTFSFDTNILQNFNGLKGGKKGAKKF